MAKFTIDGLTYTDKLPHSRLERILYQILKKEGGGGGGETADLVVDNPEDLGNGLLLVGNTITLNVADKMDTNEELPITSNAVYEQLEIADSILQRI